MNKIKTRVFIVDELRISFAQGIEIDLFAGGKSDSESMENFEASLIETQKIHTEKYGNIEKLIKQAPEHVINSFNDYCSNKIFSHKIRKVTKDNFEIEYHIFKVNYMISNKNAELVREWLANITKPLLVVSSNPEKIKNMLSFIRKDSGRSIINVKDLVSSKKNTEEFILIPYFYVINRELSSDDQDILKFKSRQLGSTEVEFVEYRKLIISSDRSVLQNQDLLRRVCVLNLDLPTAYDSGLAKELKFRTKKYDCSEETFDIATTDVLDYKILIVKIPSGFGISYCHKSDLDGKKYDVDKGVSLAFQRIRQVNFKTFHINTLYGFVTMDMILGGSLPQKIKDLLRGNVMAVKLK